MLFTIEDYELNETQVVVKFEFTPAERQILYPNDDAHEGCPAEVEIYSVIEDNLVELVDTLTTYEQYAMEEACFAKVEDHFEAIQCGKDDAAEAREDERRGR